MEKLKHVDGVLYPGGGGDYIEMGRTVLDFAKKMNDDGHFFPVWGTCLGFQRLVMYTADMGEKAISEIGAHHISLPIEFTVDPEQTKMFGDLGKSAWEFEKNNFTYNSHTYGIHP